MAPAGTSPTAGGSNALKIALIIIAVVVGLGIMGAIIAGIAVHRIARHSRVITTDGGAKVVTPFGTVQTTTDVSKISGALGGDVYPGASMSEGGSDVNMGGRHVVSANLSTSDSPDKVADYYKQKYPRSIITDAEGKHSIVYKDDDRMVTIAIEPEGGRTLIHISRISR
ncbi:MAG: hypothetical protein JO187_08955, partial [Acidobacteria bacterium]|nr:hypothetical protein [Acidobacteriota bacterium]